MFVFVFSQIFDASNREMGRGPFEVEIVSEITIKIKIDVPFIFTMLYSKNSLTSENHISEQQ